MTTRTKLTLGGALAALVAVAFSVGIVVAQTPAPSPPPMSESSPTHEQMHQMMDLMHGEGASQRMHEAIGEDAEVLMDQCAAMMVMMGGQTGGSMRDMMGR